MKSLVFGILLVIAYTHNSSGGFFAATSDLNYERSFHTATLLTNGNVLVAGGSGDNNTAEIYSPDTRAWTQTGNLNEGRGFHTETLLLNGKVLVAGGLVSTGFLASAETYDPASGSWTRTGSMSTPRYNHRATLLPNGMVLVTGGYSPDPDTNYWSVSISSAELYNPTNGTWTNVVSVAKTRSGHTSTMLPDGRVLVAGGYGDAAAYSTSELYDLNTGLWSSGGFMFNGHGIGTATLLTGGKVLVAGGPNNFVTLFDPTNTTWKATNSMAHSRYGHAATLLTNGNVLVTGGYDNTGAGVLSSVEIFNPLSGGWTSNSSLIAQRHAHTATLLTDGTVLIAGGYFNNTPKLTELFVDSPRSAVAIILKNGQRPNSNTFRFGFDNTPGWRFTTLASTNISLPLSNWTEIGRATELSPGKFQFTDVQATNGPQRFYRVRAD